MNKIIYVDFNSSTVQSVEEVEEKELKLDPVLEIVKSQLSEANFETYQRTIDDWMERCFMYEMEQRNSLENQ